VGQARVSFKRSRKPGKHRQFKITPLTTPERNMNLKLPTLYKRLLAFLIVIGPIFWLVLTEDGQRRTDSMVLYLWGEDEINFNLEALDSQFTEDDLKKVFPDIEWLCQDKPSAFGNRMCAARIGIFNGIPARYIAVFFQDRWINSVKIAYRPIYHNQLIEQLRQQVGTPETDHTQDAESSQPIELLRWETGKGHIILKSVLDEKEEPALLWLANAAPSPAG
jgi:hypothetical protein